ncbi:MAG: hypothetical protein IIB57_15880, partial [Planctomycetes bacterium]|nr:hypothetical protein [Planctomycetota bacterium]
MESHSMQGQAICGGILDEMAFMAVIEQSTQVPGPRGQGGRFDQAELVHREAINRRNRSFTTRGISIGTICVLSNTRYQGDFLDRRLKELENRNQPHVYYRRLKRHELRPEDVAAVRRKDTIRVLVGTEQYQTRVLKEDEDVGDAAHVEFIPRHYEYQFRDDPESALRNICGISTGVIRPFIPQRNKIADAFGAARTPEVFVLDKERAVRYCGRIDDQYSVGVSKPRVTRNDLAIALDELLSDK